VQYLANKAAGTDFSDFLAYCTAYKYFSSFRKYVMNIKRYMWLERSSKFKGRGIKSIGY
jgi:hypothetical protein